MADAGVLGSPFPRYWLSAFLADAGDGIRLAAFPLLAAGLTASPAAVAGVTAVQGLPWLLMGLGIGSLVDRRDLRSVMVGVDVVRALLIAALALAVLLHAASLPLIYLTAFVTGAGSMARDTAASTAVPRLVGSAELDQANGRLVAGSIVGRELAGPALGGWLFGVAAALPFAVNAGGLGIAVLLLLTLPSVFAPARGAAVPGERRSIMADIREGLRWLGRDRQLRTLVTTVGVVAAADGAYFAVLVLYVTQVLHQQAAVYGLLLAIGAVGGVAAGTSCARLIRRIGARRTLAATVAVMAGCQLALGLSSSIVISALALACSSGAFAAFNATSITVRQRRTPPALLGRVNSVYLTVGRGGEALGALAGGALAAVAGVPAPILAGVPPMLAVAVMIMRPSTP